MLAAHGTCGAAPARNAYRFVNVPIGVDPTG